MCRRVGRNGYALRVSLKVIGSRQVAMPPSAAPFRLGGFARDLFPGPRSSSGRWVGVSRSGLGGRELVFCDIVSTRL